jgi:hypothetical protein
MRSDTGISIRYHSHKHLAREEFNAAGVLSFQQFDRVDWEIMHSALMTIPIMFQVWACKQVWGIAITNRESPSCRQVPETCCHILHCPHKGRVEEALNTTISLINKWMKINNMDLDLWE